MELKPLLIRLFFFALLLLFAWAVGKGVLYALKHAEMINRIRGELGL